MRVEKESRGCGAKKIRSCRRCRAPPGKREMDEGRRRGGANEGAIARVSASDMYSKAVTLV